MPAIQPYYQRSITLHSHAAPPYQRCSHQQRPCRSLIFLSLYIHTILSLFHHFICLLFFHYSSSKQTFTFTVAALGSILCLFCCIFLLSTVLLPLLVSFLIFQPYTYVSTCSYFSCATFSLFRLIYCQILIFFSFFIEDLTSFVCYAEQPSSECSKLFSRRLRSSFHSCPYLGCRRFMC